MLFHLFSGLGIRTAATHANLNNLIGVPATILGIDRNAEIALVECGISEQGEMSRLSQIVQPDIAVITGIGSAHSAGLGGNEGVASEKARLADHLRPQGWCALGMGVSASLESGLNSRQRLDMESDDAAVVRWQLGGNDLELIYGEERARLELILPAEHWAADMALAATIVLKYLHDNAKGRARSLSVIATVLAGWQPVEGRMKLFRNSFGATIIDDSYNANPASMQAALDTLTKVNGERIAILGDMAELSDAAGSHRDLKAGNCDSLVLVGPLMREQLALHPEAHWFATADEAAEWARNSRTRFTDHTTILVKGSRSMQLDRIVRTLAGEEDIDAL